MFFKRIYREWRSFFWVLLLLLAAQAFFMFKGIQNMPFFLYHMYSRDHQRKDSVAVFLVKTKDGYWNHKNLSGREQEILINSVGYYDNLRRDGDGILLSIDQRLKGRAGQGLYQYAIGRLYNAEKRMQDFPAWWGRYFCETAGHAFDSVSVVKSYISRDAPFGKSAGDSVLFTIKLK